MIHAVADLSRDGLAVAPAPLGDGRSTCMNIRAYLALAMSAHAADRVYRLGGRGVAWCCLRDDGQVQEVVCPLLGGRVGAAPAWLHSLTTTAVEPGWPAVSCTCNGWESRRE